MKHLKSWAFTALMAFTTLSCDDNGPDTAPEVKGYTLTEQNGVTWLEGTVDKDLTLSASKEYMLKGFVYVKAPATLTIEPGTIIKGDQTTNATLIIEQGGKIMAEGTATKPIVFTSAKAKGSRSAGNWGGLIVLGKAPTNLGANAMIEGGVDRSYGGTDVNDNSGILKYVRIEYSGIAFQPDNEVNGLTLGGVGAGTTIDYVQVSFNGDDAFEFFGGTVNAKHLIAYKTVDDMFDTDNGFSGKLQFLVGLSNPNVADASSSNGFESDGNSSGSDATPKTAATFSNVSLFGPKASSSTTSNSLFKRAMHVRRNSTISVHNSLFAGWPEGLLLDGSKSQTNATSGTLKMQNVVISGTPAGKELLAEKDSNFDVAAWFLVPAKNNDVVADNASLLITGAFNQATPDFRPGAGSTLLNGASFTGMDAFFTTVSYKGAFGTEDWTAGWTNWNPQQTEY